MLLKYYKGLGTWQNKEAKLIFENYDKNIVRFVRDEVVCDHDKSINYNDYCI